MSRLGEVGRRVGAPYRFRFRARFRATRVRGDRALRACHLWRFRHYVLPEEVLKTRNRQRWQPRGAPPENRREAFSRPKRTSVGVPNGKGTGTGGAHRVRRRKRARMRKGRGPVPGPSSRWAHQDSNLGPTGYEPAALTAELWALAPSYRGVGGAARMAERQGSRWTWKRRRPRRQTSSPRRHQEGHLSARADARARVIGETRHA